MEKRAIEMLDEHRLMTIATVRPDGWPQATMVSYVNDGLLIYFLISRASQKFANIRADQRVSIAIGRDFDDPAQIQGLSMAALASEVTDADQRRKAYRLLLDRHPEFARFAEPDLTKAAIMRAACRIATLIDYRDGFGHADTITVGGPEIVGMQPARHDDWGLNPAADPKRLLTA
jgi:nitroimidazol reductase NimA-like FMN-containing flavoprotein (pyridoxamine 5'-phosphate oxidase superfamily)